MLIDTHCHLTKRFWEDPKSIIDAAKAIDVEKLICVGTNLEDSQEAIEIAVRFEGVYASVGIHPEETCNDWDKFEKLARNKTVVAIGECGLDYKVGSLNQKEIFIKQIEIAQKLNFPLIIHSRDAADDVLEILSKHKNLKGVFHFYNFGKSKIKTVLDMGFYFGVDGNLTYEEGLQNVYKNIPLDRILLETDSPDLAPEPVRGSKNEPKNVKIIASLLSELKGVSLEELARITSENATRLFGI